MSRPNEADDRPLEFVQCPGCAELRAALLHRSFGTDEPTAWAQLEGAAARAIVIAHKVASQVIPERGLVEAEAVTLILQMQVKRRLPDGAQML